MSDLFDNIFSALDDNPFEETPVDVKTFVEGEGYLNQPPLSEIQYTIVECMSQIYRVEDLARYMGRMEAEEHHRKYTKKELILALGKGSGKDHTSTIGVAYIVYKLLCLKDPARYYGTPSGDAIDIMNIAINSTQAKNVFFKGFKSKITRSKWFRGRYHDKTDSVEFDKAITVYSGHSEREAHEGLNLFCAILDEISGFAMESTSGNVQAKTADAIYKAFRGTVDSRFPDLGKVVLLSFPRFKEDYISQKYNEAVAQKEVKIRKHQYKIDLDMPDGIPGNEFDIEWEEDHIVGYTYPGIFALKRPTWEVNPIRTIEHFKHAFYTDTEDALQRFACMPPDTESGYFKNRESMKNALSLPPSIVEHEDFQPWFKPDPGKEYYMHVDLAQQHDRCAVAMAHVENWYVTSNVMGKDYFAPKIIIDFVFWWTPTANKSVDFKEVRAFILNIRRQGFDVKLVTFDRWNSHDMMQELNGFGMETNLLSVAKTHYDEFKLAIAENRILGPDIELLLKEYMSLQLIKGKVDHPRSGGKDLADAATGAFYNAATLSRRDDNSTVEVRSIKDIFKEEDKPELEMAIDPPKMPQELQDYIFSISSV